MDANLQFSHKQIRIIIMWSIFNKQPNVHYFLKGRGGFFLLLLMLQLVYECTASTDPFFLTGLFSGI